jgi:predicted permease
LRWIDHLGQDLRSGIRQLRRSPRFTAAAILTLTLGIGATTAIFTVADAVLFRGLPYQDPERLVQVWNTFRQHRMEEVVFSHLEFLDYRSRLRAIEDLAAYSQSSVTLTHNGNPEQIWISGVSHNLFGLLGVAPVHGRGFQAHENQAGAPNVVILGHALWQRRFGGDARIIGSAIALQGEPYTVVGIMPPAFRSPATQAEAWRPLVFAGELMEEPQRGSRSLWMIARLKPSTSLADARREMAFHAQQIGSERREQYPKELGHEVVLVPLHDQVTGGVRRALLVMLGAVGMLLLISCANVANLLLARASERRVEVSVRSALGASRCRIALQMLTESALLAVLGGAAGTLLAVWSVDLLMRWMPLDVLPRSEEVVVRSTVLWFSIGLSFATGLLFGLAPALHSTTSGLMAALKDEARSAVSRRGNGLRGVLMATEVALALVLLTGAGLLIRSFTRLVAVPAGFRPENTLTMRIALPAAKYPARAQQIAFFDSVTQRTGALPGIEAVGLVTSLPFSGWRNDWSITSDDVPAGGGTEARLPPANYFAVNAAYFQSMGIPLLRGRGFGAADASAEPVVIVNRTFAERFWPRTNPIGRRLKMGGPESPWPWRTVVGVVGDVRQTNLETAVMPEIFVLYNDERKPIAPAMFVVVRSHGDPTALIPMIRREVAGVDAGQALTSIRSMSERVSLSLAERRLHVLLLAIFAAVAVALAAVGVYGVIACAVAQRTREIGLRMALGAKKSDVFRLVIGKGMWVACIGVVAGLVGSASLARVLDSLLFEVEPTDPVTFAAVAAILSIVALLACAIPARRASALDPMEALRRL